MNHSVLFFNWLLVALIFLCHLPKDYAQHSVPGKYWMQYKEIAETGFSPERLEQIKVNFDSTQAASLFVVYKGNVLISQGDVTRRYMVHSIRKSFMNALYGVYINNGRLDLTKDLQSLGIDDHSPLTAVEKQATIRDLMSARSGVYLPAAYSPRGMSKNLPERGSHRPGTFWYYNNWDFNVLSTIFEQQIGNKVFEDFYGKIAQPLGMEDFRLLDGHYRIEPEKSKHAAYLFKMSARDMARFGLLYLNKGKWNNQQLIPVEWVEKSTSIISEDLGEFSNRGGYGYLWWVSNDFYGHRMFYASGSGGHRIVIFPDDDLVIVHRVNTYEGKRVANQKINSLLKDILAAKVQDGIAQPKCVNLSLPEKSKFEVINLETEYISKYSGDYKHPYLGIFTIRKGESGLLLATNVGDFQLYARDKNHFVPEDLGTMIEMTPSPSEEQKYSIQPVFSANRTLEKAIFYY